jgi:dephospho-CoA kinase
MKIGITGIYASGKGTVCSMFEELGAQVIDTDILARKIVEPESKGYYLLIREFGEAILNSDRSLSRIALADIVFKDPLKVKKLNEITHPLILEKMLGIINSESEKIYMINVPLLFESGFDKYTDYTIVVFAKDDQVIKRGINRDNLTETQIKDRLKNQISLNEKLKLADYVIDNSITIENTKRQVIEIWKTLQQKNKRV